MNVLKASITFQNDSLEEDCCIKKNVFSSGKIQNTTLLFTNFKEVIFNE